MEEDKGVSQERLGLYVSRSIMKSFNLAQEDAQSRNKWRRKTSEPAG